MISYLDQDSEALNLHPNEDTHAYLNITMSYMNLLAK